MNLRLIGRTTEKLIDGELGLSLLDMALKHDIDWGFSCTQGTCARCRCLVEEGQANLNEPTDAEWDRLDEEELEDGYRLGCQAVWVKEGPVTARNKTYF